MIKYIPLEAEPTVSFMLKSKQLIISLIKSSQLTVCDRTILGK